MHQSYAALTKHKQQARMWLKRQKREGNVKEHFDKPFHCVLAKNSYHISIEHFPKVSSKLLSFGNSCST